MILYQRVATWSILERYMLDLRLENKFWIIKIQMWFNFKIVEFDF